MRRQLTGTASSARAAAAKEPGPANVVPPAVAAHEAQPRPAHAAAEGSGAAIMAPADAAAKQAAELQAQQQQARHGTAVQLPQAQADAGALRDSAAVPAQDWKPPISTAPGPAASHEPQPMALDSLPPAAQPASATQDPCAPAAPEAAVTTAATLLGPGQAAAPAAEPPAAQEPAAASTQDACDAATTPAPGAAAPAAAQDVDKLLASDEVLPAPEAMQDDSSFPKQEAGMGDDEKHAVAALLAAASGVSSGDAAAMQDLQAGLGPAGQSISSIPYLCNPWLSVGQALICCGGHLVGQEPTRPLPSLPLTPCCWSLMAAGSCGKLHPGRASQMFWRVQVLLGVPVFCHPADGLWRLQVLLSPTCWSLSTWSSTWGARTTTMSGWRRVC